MMSQPTNACMIKTKHHRHMKRKNWKKKGKHINTRLIYAQSNITLVMKVGYLAAKMFSSFTHAKVVISANHCQPGQEEQQQQQCHPSQSSLSSHFPFCVCWKITQQMLISTLTTLSKIDSTNHHQPLTKEPEAIPCVMERQFTETKKVTHKT